MIINHSRKFIFFSNPKTGSETVRKVLAPWSEEPIVAFNQRIPERPFYPHMSPTEAAWIFDDRGWDFQSYTRITCVRNPYDRLVSLYRMICDVDGVWQLRKSMNFGPPSFGRWLRASRPDGRGGGGRRHQRWRRYGAWSAKTWCADQIDHVLRLEHLNTDLERVFTELGISAGDVPHINRRGHICYSDWYNQTLSDLVQTRYSWDLAAFDYQPPKLRMG